MKTLTMNEHITKTRILEFIDLEEQIDKDVCQRLDYLRVCIQKILEYVPIESLEKLKQEIEGSKALTEKQKIELVKPLAKYGFKESFFNFADLPAETAKQLLSAWPNVNPKDRQNSSPTMKKLVETATEYNGTLNGYCIPVESGRDDARITFDAVVLKIDKQTMLKLKRSLKPNNTSLLADGSYRFWWD